MDDCRHARPAASRLTHVVGIENLETETCLAEERCGKARGLLKQSLFAEGSGFEGERCSDSAERVMLAIIFEGRSLAANTQLLLDDGDIRVSALDERER